MCEWAQWNRRKKKKKRLTQTVSRDRSFWWALAHLLGTRACSAVTFWLGQAFWICHAKDPTWNSPCTSAEDRPRAAHTYHLNCNRFHTETMTLNKVHGHITWTSYSSYRNTTELLGRLQRKLFHCGIWIELIRGTGTWAKGYLTPGIFSLP